MNKELKKIKKLYGEDMAHYVREVFPIILEQEGKLLEILTSTFEPNKELYKDLENANLLYGFKNLIYKKFDKKREDNYEKDVATPEELMDKAGYTLYKCETEEDIQRFRKYYSLDLGARSVSEENKILIRKFEEYIEHGGKISEFPGGIPYYNGEELCTFAGNRLKRCYVWFAVKDNINEIKRENFNNPIRDDEYGTSVISIQFTRDDSHTLSIKNRYNHTVVNPDATLHNNLDNIASGLTKSFAIYYGMLQNISNGIFEIPYYVIANDGKYYKYNYEIGNTYYCPGNIIIDNFEVIRYPKEQYIIMDYFILNLKDKRLETYNGEMQGDSFCEINQDIKEILVENVNNGKKITLISSDNKFSIIELDNENRIIKYKNENVKSIGDDFLIYNRQLSNIYLPNVQIIGNEFLYHNKQLSSINLPNVKSIGNNFMAYNDCQLSSVYLPNVLEIGNSFLSHNEQVLSLDLPNILTIGGFFLYYKERFLANNIKLLDISLPNIKEIGDDFLRNNINIDKNAIINGVERISR